MRHKKFNIKFTPQLVKETFVRWWDDDGPRLGASLSYYTAFSLAPLLLLTISLAGAVFGEAAAHGKVLDELRSTMGTQAALSVQEMLKAAHKPAASVIATVIGFLTLLLGASVVMNDLKFSLNKIWRVEAPKGIKVLIKDKLLSMGMVLVIGFLLLVSLVASVAFATIGNLLNDVYPVTEWMLNAMTFLTSFILITLLFAAIFKALPNAQIKWRDVWVGAGLTSFLFSVGKLLLGLYLGKSTIGSTYGTAGSFLVMLTWLYYSSQILYFGAEFTKVYADKYGSGVKQRIEKTN